MTAPNTDAALARLTRLVLAENNLQTVMQAVADATAEAVPGADAVSVTVLERGRPRTVAQTDELALALDEQQYALGSGPCLDGIAGGELLEIPDMTRDSRWPDYAPRAAALGAGSSLSIPLPLQREVAAALNVYSRRPRAFDDSSREAARTVAAHAGVAVANMHLYETQERVAEQLQVAMQSRATIEQAKGVLMGQRGVSAEQAFSLLVELSQRSNRKLRDVAQAVVESVVADRPDVEPSAE